MKRLLSRPSRLIGALYGLLVKVHDLGLPLVLVMLTNPTKQNIQPPKKENNHESTETDTDNGNESEALDVVDVLSLSIRYFGISMNLLSLASLKRR